MAGAYSLSLGGATLVPAAGITLNFLNPIAAPNIDFNFKRFWVGQSNNMASAQQRVALVTQVTAFPTLANQAPNKLAIADAASLITGNTTGAAGTCGVNATAEGGTKTTILADTFNVIPGWLCIPTPEEKIEMSSGAASGIGLFLPVAPGTLTNWAWGWTWLEE